MNMRVAMISNEYPPFLGGIASYLQATARALAQLGVDVHIITRQWDATAPGATHRTEEDGVTVHRLATGKQRWRATPSFIVWSTQLIRTLQPNLIHAHELLLPTTVALAAKRLTGQPVVATVHTAGEMGDCVRLKNAALGEQRVQYVRNAVDRFVTISSVVAADMKAIGIPAHKRVLIPNGVDMRRYHPVGPEAKAALRRQLGLPDGPLVVFTGRLSPEKRVLPLAQQWPSLRRAYPDATLVLVGDGPEMPRLCELEGRGILLAGRQQDVVPFLQAADLFAMPSATEGFSLSTLEALACGLPTVATAVGAIPDLMDDCETGRLVAPDDMPAFMDALCELLANRHCWPSMGNAARNNVVRRYSLPNVACQLLELYHQL